MTGVQTCALPILLVYVIAYNDGTTPQYGYFEKVASEWNRNHVSTIEEAISHTRERAKNIEDKKVKSKNLLPKDIESDWLDDYIKSTR